MAHLYLNEFVRLDSFEVTWNAYFHSHTVEGILIFLGFCWKHVSNEYADAPQSRIQMWRSLRYALLYLRVSDVIPVLVLKRFGGHFWVLKTLTSTLKGGPSTLDYRVFSTATPGCDPFLICFLFGSLNFWREIQIIAMNMIATLWLNMGPLIQNLTEMI